MGLNVLGYQSHLLLQPQESRLLYQLQRRNCNLEHGLPKKRAVLHTVYQKQAQLQKSTFPSKINFDPEPSMRFLQHVHHVDDAVTKSIFFLSVFSVRTGKARNMLFWGILKKGPESAFSCLVFR